ncbi:MAG: hypothetical protein R3270_06230 [Gammaproteobacteria bacterium]|nr:hypothetical protein [Gammaproteobacteria bacterium]
MKQFIRIGVAFAALFSFSVLAGYTQPAPVDVQLNGDGSGFAGGDMVSARYADNETEFIGCGSRVFSDGAGGTFEWGFCQGEDVEGDRAFCTTTDPAMLESMSSTSDYAFVTFRWNASGECEYIGFSTQSFYLPDQPEFPGSPGRGR